MKNVLFLMTAVFSILTILHTNVFAEGKGDTTAPTGSVTINNGASSTNSPSVTLGLSATDDRGVTGYYVSESSTKPSASASGWTSITSTTSYSASVPYTLSSGDGSKTVYVWYKDAAGNISSVSSDSITLTTSSTPTPTPSPKVSPSPTPTPTSTGTPTPTSTATPIVIPTPTTTPTPTTGHTAALALNKSEAFLNGDSIVVTVVDVDLNTSHSAIDTGSVKIKSDSDTAGFSLKVTETAVYSGTFLSTFMTAYTTDASATPPKIGVTANSEITVIYSDTSTATGTRMDISSVVQAKNFGATVAFDQSAVALGEYAGITLSDKESNKNISTIDTASVTVKSSTDSTGTTLSLTETGARSLVRYKLAQAVQLLTRTFSLRQAIR